MLQTIKIPSLGSGNVTSLSAVVYNPSGNVIDLAVTFIDAGDSEGTYYFNTNFTNPTISSLDSVAVVVTSSVTGTSATTVVANDLIGGGGGGGPTVAEIVTGLINAISITSVPTVVSSLGTYFVITSSYSANLPGFADFIIQQNSLYPVFSAACYYQGNQIQVASATFRVWLEGDEIDNLVDAAMTVNEDYSVTYNWQTGDLPLAGDFQFQIVLTDLNGDTIPVPFTKNGLLTVTPQD